MKNLFRVCSAVVLMSCFAFQVAHAQNQPSAKATVKVSAVNLLEPLTATAGASSNVVVEGPWTTILQNSIKTPNQKDLLINASLEVGLLTNTLVRSKLGISDTSKAVAGVEVRILVDGNTAKPALPGTVIYGRRSQTLTATFMGLFTSACFQLVDTNADGIPDTIQLIEDCFTPEELQLVLDTMDAASFNFVVPDVPTGVHTVAVQARIVLDTSAQTGTAIAQALVGKGAVTIESVRLIKNEDVIDVP